MRHVWVLEELRREEWFPIFAALALAKVRSERGFVGLYRKTRIVKYWP